MVLFEWTGSKWMDGQQITCTNLPLTGSLLTQGGSVMGGSGHPIKEASAQMKGFGLRSLEARSNRSKGVISPSTGDWVGLMNGWVNG